MQGSGPCKQVIRKLSGHDFHVEERIFAAKAIKQLKSVDYDLLLLENCPQLLMLLEKAKVGEGKRIFHLHNAWSVPGSSPVPVGAGGTPLTPDAGVGPESELAASSGFPPKMCIRDRSLAFPMGRPPRG